MAVSAWTAPNLLVSCVADDKTDVTFDRKLDASSNIVCARDVDWCVLAAITRLVVQTVVSLTARTRKLRVRTQNTLSVVRGKWIAAAVSEVRRHNRRGVIIAVHVSRAGIEKARVQLTDSVVEASRPVTLYKSRC